MSESETMESLSGTISRIVFRNEETGSVILRVAVKGRKEPVTALGFCTGREGEFVTMDGSWSAHPSFGMQFKAKNIVVALPVSKDGIAKYLASGIVKGIGEKMAQRIVERFGESVFVVMDNEIERLTEVKGIGAGRIEKIKAGWVEQAAVRQIMVFLQSHDISAAMAHRIYKTYEGRALEIIQQNPWKLSRDVKGIGFLTADQIALSMGKDPTAPERLKAGLAHKLFEASSGGHCGMETANLIRVTSEALNVPVGIVGDAYDAELKSKKPSFIEEDKVTWIAHLHGMETKIAERLLDLAARKPVWGEIDAEEAIRWVEFDTNATLADQQKEALRQATKSRVMVITGGPGCGKTFLLNSVLKVLARERIGILLAAPTGKAACRMTESTGRESSTMHRLMKLGRSTEEIEMLNCDLLVLDESSMIDVQLFYHALRRLPAHASLLLVGDADQIPSVGPGSVLNDLINSEAIPVVRLNKVFRQAEDSFIIKNAHRVNQGLMPEKAGRDGDFFFIPENDPDQIPLVIEKLVTERLPNAYGMNPLSDIQVLCPMKKSPSGTLAMNLSLQKALNPSPAVSHMRFGTRYGIGDRVMQTSNNYDKGVFNGDSGEIVAMDTEDTLATVDFQGNLVEYDYTELDQLVLSMAMTIHKSQGSDYPAVIIPVTTQHYMMLQRNLIYTGITRARRVCIIVGQEKALEMAIKNQKAACRITRLEKLLRTAAA